MAILHLVQEFLAARQQALTDPVPFERARQALLASNQGEVLAVFESLRQAADDEERAETLTGLALLYGRLPTDTVLRWMDDPSSIVRFVACTSFPDDDDEHVVAALLDRLKSDPDCQVRGVAANKLGHMGAIEALPELHYTWQTDLELDELGYTASGSDEYAISSILKDWVLRQVQGTPPKTFSESTGRGKLTGTVTAEAIPFDAEGRLSHTPRYAHLPHEAYGPGCAFNSELQTSLITPFEIEVEYADPTCVIGRILIYDKIVDWDKFNWTVSTILDPAVMKDVSRS